MYKALKTLNEMIVDRGFHSNQNFNITPEIFKNNGLEGTVSQIKINESLSITGYRTSNQHKKLLVFFNDLIKGNVYKILEFMEKNDYFECIVVLKTKKEISHQTKKLIRFLEEKGIYIQVFNVQELQKNVTKSFLVPKHILLSPQQKEEVLKNLKCNDDELPKIKNFDPQARYYGAKVGEVFKIIRPSETTGATPWYRIVTE